MDTKNDKQMFLYETPQAQAFQVMTEGILCNSKNQADPLEGWYDEFEF